MKLLLVFALIHLATALPEITPEQCKNWANEADFHLGVMYGFPSTESDLPTDYQLTVFCRDAKTALEDLTRYQKCLQEFPEKVFIGLIRAIVKTKEKSCSGKAERQELLKILHCTAGKTDKVSACSFGTWNVLDQLADQLDANSEDNPITAAFCCLSLLNEDCIATRMNQIKCKDASVKPGEHLEIFSAPLHSDVLSGICQDYKTIAACEAKIPNEFAKFKTSVFNETARAKRTMLFSLMRVAEKVFPQTDS